jgi:eukaryotic-like serine/threonine-protein kinase
MGTNDLPNDPRQKTPSDISDRTLSSGAVGGVSAGQIGPYRLLQRVGEGGMGEVWLAEQTSPIHRTVALKLIKAGMDTHAVVARFESERQALALMDHPNIARVFDAASTPEGRPYFVMEYVPGLPITEYCDKHRLSVKERLELFMQVCDGVQHAHQKAIIHRDLKPSNVLVVLQDNKAVPKIIDFGLAKANAQSLTDKTMFTELGVRVGTPEYMSPEQADLREQNIDTRTDVYSLGVIFYELLVGVLPFEMKQLRAEGLEAVLRVIREQEPAKPSTKIRSMGEKTNTAAENRREEPRSFARRLQGELDWITLKALEKDRTRRYGSPSEFASDIQRHLRHEAVLAGPPSAAYRASKFVRRHRFGVAAAAAAVVILIAFAAAMTVQARRIARERDRANREAEVSQRVSDFMTNMFKVSDPSESRGNTITAREILDKASKNVESGLAQEPEVQAQMMYTMASVYEGLGLFRTAESLAAKSRELRQRILGADNPATLKSLAMEASVLANESRYPESEKLRREVLEDSRRVFGPESKETVREESALARVLNDQGRYADAEKINREALEIAMRKFGVEDPATRFVMRSLATDLGYQNKFSEAEPIGRELLAIQRRVLGSDHPDTLAAENDLAATLLRDKKQAEAEVLFRDVVETRRRVQGLDHPYTLMAMGNLALTLNNEKRYEDAEKLYRETLEIKRQNLGPEHRSTVVTESNLADTLIQENKYPEAEKLLREALEIERRTLGPQQYDTLSSMGALGQLLMKEKRYAEAEKLNREQLEGMKRSLGPDHEDVADSAYSLACILSWEKKRDEALSLLRYAVEHGLSAENDLKIEKDPELQSIREMPGFADLVAYARQRAAVKERNPS